MSKATRQAAAPSASHEPAFRPTLAVDLLVVAYEALAPAEQDEALKRMRDLALKRDADQRSLAAQYLASLQRAAEIAGCQPEDLGADAYRAAIKTEAESNQSGERMSLAPLSQVIKHFGTWRQAKEALSLSASSTPLQIEARFACRRVGRAWRYEDRILRETLQRCANELGYPPQVGEFRAWRERELELARAQGDHSFHLPSLNSYRRRNRYWKDTLRLFLGDEFVDGTADHE